VSELLFTFGLAISIASQGGVHVKDDAWIVQQIASANELFAPAGVSFRWTLEKALADAHAAMHSPADRDDLSALTEKTGSVDVFLVSELEDIDEPGRMRKGVVWTHKPDGKRYVVLSAAAPIGVLAHELGHFFGNPHTKVEDNVMSYLRSGGPTAFDDDQIARIGQFSRNFFASGRLLEVGVPRRMP